MKMNKFIVEEKINNAVKSQLPTIILIQSIMSSLYYFNHCDDTQHENYLTNLVSKTCSTSFLTYYTYLKQKRKQTPLVLGLGSHTLGDSVLAMIPDSLIPAIPFFTAGHLFYTYELSKKPKIKSLNTLVKRKNKIIGLCAYAVLINIILHNHVDEQLQTIIPIYTAALLSSVLMESLLEKQELSLAIGLFSYILSDSIIAMNNFVVNIPYDDKTSWFLYYSSQLLISNALSKPEHKNSQPNSDPPKINTL